MTQVGGRGSGENLTPTPALLIKAEGVTSSELRQVILGTRNRIMTLAEARELLDLEPKATKKEIKTAYRRAARLWHPDRAPAIGEEALYRHPDAGD